MLSFQYKENLTNWITEMKLATGAQKSEHMNSAISYHHFKIIAK
jgi:hypothetical protein